MPDIQSAPSGSDHRDETLNDQKLAESLVGLHRSISAWLFYPANHPTLGEALSAGYQAWELSGGDPRWAQPGLQLRSGGLWFGETRIGEGNPAVGSLVRMFAGHGLVGLRRTGSLRQEGFASLVATLATAPEVVAGRGGLCAVWQSQPAAGALGLEALSVTAGAGAGELLGTDNDSAPGEPKGGDLPVPPEDLEGTDPFVLSRLLSLQQRSPQERVLVDLLLRLGRTEETDAFRDLLREITRHVNAYLDRGQYQEVFYVALYLRSEAENREAAGQGDKRDHLVDTIRVLVQGDMLDWLIGHVKTAEGRGETERAEQILRALGTSGVVEVINALCAEGGRRARRRLVNVLVSLGEPSVPWAVRMLDDRRWFVVRNMVTVLGGIGSPEARKALVRLSRDPDPRIRREVARALVRGSVESVEEPLLALLGDRDHGVRLMAVKASAGHGSRRMLQAVWRAYRKTSIRSAHWELKVVALHSVGRMGLAEAEGALLRVLRRRGWFFRDRWLRVRCAAARALGQVGGEAAGRVLARFRDGGQPELRVAAARALDALERRGKEGL